jgi:putative hemolysin
MKRLRLPISALITIVLVLSSMAAAAQQRPAASRQLSVPIVGTSSDGSRFTGTVTVQRFEERAGQVFAIGVVSGSLSGAAGPIGTAINVPAAFPVQVGPGLSARADRGRVNPASLSMPNQGGRLMLVQQATCGVLHLELGAINLNLLGVVVTTTPVTIDISGDTAGPLGALVCQILNTLQSVVGLVGLLNQLLGLVTGLLGGVVGGIGAPMAI